jgi:hypothetical protein
VGKSVLLSQQWRDRSTIVHRTRTALAWLTTSVLVLTLILMPQPGSAQDKLTPKFVTGLLDLPIRITISRPVASLWKTPGSLPNQC